MPNEHAPFTPDVPPITPEGVIEDMIENGIKEVLGTHKEILYIGHREIKSYIVEDMRVYIWSDSRGRENSIFISEEYVGKNYTITWYRARKTVSQTTIKIPNQRDFIERCVLGEVTPESLTK